MTTNLKNIVIFANYQEDNENMQVRSADSGWAELAQAFLQFLHGSGYAVTADDLAEFYGEQNPVELPLTPFDSEGRN